MRYRGQGTRTGIPSSDPPMELLPPARSRIKVVVITGDGTTASPFDCTGCPDDPRPHLHCPWGGMHKHYAGEGTGQP